MPLASSSQGVVYWLTGLSGAGKTTVARLLHQRLLEMGRPAVLLDGDQLRGVFGEIFGYSLEHRRLAAGCYGRLCKLLADQGIDVVIATISLFHACQRWNRQNIANYREIYLRCDLRTLVERDAKGLYAQAGPAGGRQMVGLNLAMEEPRSPDLVIDNDGTLSPREVCASICHAVIEGRGGPAATAVDAGAGHGG